MIFALFYLGCMKTLFTNYFLKLLYTYKKKLWISHDSVSIFIFENKTFFLLGIVNSQKNKIKH